MEKQVTSDNQTSDKDEEALAWSELSSQRPEIAEFGQARIDGKVAYLATVRKNGKPRTHPVTPLIGHGRCFIFVEPTSAKARDLRENGYFSLHCAMNDSSGRSGEFRLTGTARLIDDEDLRSNVVAVAPFRPSSAYLLFELQLLEVISTSYRGGRPNRKKWAVDDVSALEGI